MTALSLSPFSFFVRTRPVDRDVDETRPLDELERRKIVGEMIAAGACDSEYGVQMLMSVFPERF